MHRWTPVSSTVSYPTSTSQEVSTSTPICRQTERVSNLRQQGRVGVLGKPSLASQPLSCLNPALCYSSCSRWAGSTSVPLFQQMPTERVKW